ncbi:hypothetical protein EPO56_04195, partial [Patescibacteria group bacterium]
MIQALRRFVEGELSLRGSGLYADNKLRALAVLRLWDESTVFGLKDLDVKPQFLTLSSLVDLYRFVVMGTDHSMRKSVEDALSERFEMRGTVLQVKSDGYSMLGSADSTLSRLLITKLAIKAGPSEADLPLLFRTLLSAQKRGHWDTTVADALATIAVQKFSSVFDKEIAEGSTQVSIAAQNLELKQNEAAKTVAWPKGKSSVRIEHAANGKPWVTLSGLAAIPLSKPSSSGIRLEKKVIPIKVRKSGVKSVGDLFEVELTFRTESGQDWIGLIDPVPAGARILPANFEAAYTELGFQGMKAYFEGLTAGEHKFSYRFQLNTAGEFLLPPTRVEAL